MINMINSKDNFYTYIRKDDNNYFKIKEECDSVLDNTFSVREIETNVDKKNATIFNFRRNGNKYEIFVNNTNLQYVNIFKIKNQKNIKWYSCFYNNILSEITNNGGGIFDIKNTNLKNITYGEEWYSFDCKHLWIIKEAHNDKKFNIDKFNWNNHDDIRLVNFTDRDEFNMINKDGKISSDENCCDFYYHLTLEYIKIKPTAKLKDSNQYINYEIIITTS